MTYLLQLTEIDKTAVNHTPYALTSGPQATYFMNDVFIQDLGTGCYRVFTDHNQLAVNMPGGQIVQINGNGITNLDAGTFQDTNTTIHAFNDGASMYIDYFGTFSGTTLFFYLSLPNTDDYIPSGYYVSFSLILTPA